MYKRIISFFLAFAIVFTILSIPVCASAPPSGSFWEYLSEQEFGIDHVTSLGNAWLDKQVYPGCKSPSSPDGNHKFKLGVNAHLNIIYGLLTGHASCAYCGADYENVKIDLDEAEKDYYSGITGSSQFSGFDYLNAKGYPCYYIDPISLYSYNSSLLQLVVSPVYSDHVAYYTCRLLRDANLAGWNASSSFNAPYSGNICYSCFKDNYFGNAATESAVMTVEAGKSYTLSLHSSLGSASFKSGDLLQYCSGPFKVEYTSIKGYTPYSSPFGNSGSITLNNQTYEVNSYDFNNRTYYVTDNNSIEHKITFNENSYSDSTYNSSKKTYVTNNYYYNTTNVSPPDSDDSGLTDEQYKEFIKLWNYTNLQLEEIENALSKFEGCDVDLSATNSLILQVVEQLDYIKKHPPKDYETILNGVSNQLANIWGDLENVKGSLSVLETKVDSVNDNLQAILTELQNQRTLWENIILLLGDIDNTLNVNGTFYNAITTGFANLQASLELNLKSLLDSFNLNFGSLIDSIELHFGDNADLSGVESRLDAIIALLGDSPSDDNPDSGDTSEPDESENPDAPEIPDYTDILQKIHDSIVALPDNIQKSLKSDFDRVIKAIKDITVKVEIEDDDSDDDKPPLIPDDSISIDTGNDIIDDIGDIADMSADTSIPEQETTPIDTSGSGFVGFLTYCFSLLFSLNGMIKTAVVMFFTFFVIIAIWRRFLNV